MPVFPGDGADRVLQRCLFQQPGRNVPIHPLKNHFIHNRHDRAEGVREQAEDKFAPQVIPLHPIAENFGRNLTASASFSTVAKDLAVEHFGLRKWKWCVTNAPYHLLSNYEVPLRSATGMIQYREYFQNTSPVEEYENNLILMWNSGDRVLSAQK